MCAKTKLHPNLVLCLNSVYPIHCGPKLFFEISTLAQVVSDFITTLHAKTKKCFRIIPVLTEKEIATSPPSIRTTAPNKRFRMLECKS